MIYSVILYMSGLLITKRKLFHINECNNMQLLVKSVCSPVCYEECVEEFRPNPIIFLLTVEKTADGLIISLLQLSRQFYNKCINCVNNHN